MRFRRRNSQGGLTCREVGKKLQSHLDGELDRIEAVAVADHLDSCVDCSFEAGVYREIKHVLRRRRQAIPPETASRIRRLADSLVDGHPPGDGSHPSEWAP